VATTRSAAGYRALAAACLTVLSVLVLPPVTANAKPKPSHAEAQKQLDQLNKQVDVLVQQYDKTQQSLAASKLQLDATTRAVQAERAIYDPLRKVVAQMAATAYETRAGSGADIPSLLSGKDPAAVLNQISLFTAVTKDRSSPLSQFLASAQRLQLAQGHAKQAVDQAEQQARDFKAQKAVLDKQVAAEKKLLSQVGGPTPGQGSCNVQASGKALIAIRFACAQLGKSYVYGATGPDYYDCSGLTMRAWGAAGVSTGRTTWNQWAMFPRVSYQNLQPGDLVFFDASLGHMGMYLGGGKMIQAPHTGDVVKISDISSGYYRSRFQGGGHPS
jgi:cell wall-associated NlpC family hydrolase